VHFAAAARDGRCLHREKHYGDIHRTPARTHAVAEALGMLELLGMGQRVQDDGRV
jgi:nicotinamide-nucleotide amidase